VKIKEQRIIPLVLVYFSLDLEVFEVFVGFFGRVECIFLLFFSTLNSSSSVALGR